MRNHQAQINQTIKNVYRQWQRVILIRGCAQIIAAGGLLIGAAFVLDAVTSLSVAARATLLGATVLVGVVLVVTRIIRPLLSAPSQGQIARYLEEKHPHLEDRLVTAVEIGEGKGLEASAVMLEKLMEDARFHVENINVSHAIKSKAASLWTYTALAMLAIFVALTLSDLEMVKMQSARLATPWRFPIVKPTPLLLVKPGNLRIARGAAQQISAQTNGFTSENITLYYGENDSSWQKAEMDPTYDLQTFVYNFFDVQNGFKYYVKTDDEISPIYALTIFDKPKIKRVDLKYVFPKYTGLPAKIEKNGGDIWAPQGTVVTVTAITNKNLKSAKILLNNEQNIKTVIAQDTLAVARLIIKKDAFYAIELQDIDGLSNAPATTFYIHALPDRPPTLTINRPGRDLQATMLEETPLHISVQDDYGKPETVLKYTLNGNEEKSVPLSLLAKKARTGVAEKKIYNAEHLFYFEDLKVAPGDFLSYYVEAQNQGKSAQTVRTDIFFITIRPFETEFSRPLSQGQTAGASGGGNKLSETQRQILIATWKTLEKQEQEKEAFNEDVEILQESQQNLHEVTQNALRQLEQRSIFTKDVGSGLTELYAKAVEAMLQATKALAENKLNDAQLFQREAFRFLLQTEARIREVQIQQTQNQGAGNNASLQELSNLFEKELDKLDNKYETLNEKPQNRNGEEINEALQKVKELAKRQKQFNRQIQKLAKNELDIKEKERKIEDLRREQERIKRQTQELSREMTQLEQQNANLPSDVQESLKNATSEMNNVGHNLQNNNPELAAAKGRRALNRLNRLEDSLRKDQKKSLRRQVEELEQKLQRLAEKQRKITDATDDLANTNERINQERLDDIGQKQEDILEETERAERQVESLRKQSRSEQNQISSQLSQATDEILKKGIAERMKQARKMLAENKINSAAAANKDILKQFENAEKQLTKMRGALAETEAEKMELALSQTQKLRKHLEDLQVRANAEYPGAPGNRNGEPLPADPNADPDQSSAQDFDTRKSEKINEELKQTLQNMQSITSSFSADSSLNSKINKLGTNLGKIMRSFDGGNQQKMRLIEQYVLAPLKGLEAELAQKLALMKNQNKLFLTREQDIPNGYKELVQKYYEALSKSK